MDVRFPPGTTNNDGCKPFSTNPFEDVANLDPAYYAWGMASSVVAVLCGLSMAISMEAVGEQWPLRRRTAALLDKATKGSMAHHPRLAAGALMSVVVGHSKREPSFASTVLLLICACLFFINAAIKTANTFNVGWFKWCDAQASWLMVLYTLLALSALVMANRFGRQPLLEMHERRLEMLFQMEELFNKSKKRVRFLELSEDTIHKLVKNDADPSIQTLAQYMEVNDTTHPRTLVIFKATGKIAWVVGAPREIKELQFSIEDEHQFSCIHLHDEYDEDNGPMLVIASTKAYNGPYSKRFYEPFGLELGDRLISFNAESAESLSLKALGAKVAACKQWPVNLCFRRESTVRVEQGCAYEYRPTSPKKEKEQMIWRYRHGRAYTIRLHGTVEELTVDGSELRWALGAVQAPALEFSQPWDPIDGPIDFFITQ
jgi:hypothetical protein